MSIENLNRVPRIHLVLSRCVFQKKPGISTLQVILEPLN